MKRPALVLAVIWLLSAGYAGAGLTRGWVPHDEGTLGQSAERVLAGELPHRDYDEIYTGGLAYADALAFRVFGENLVSPRILLFIVFLLWVPAVFYLAGRTLGPLAAGGVTLLAVSWSVPNYHAAMPSWYNLFFATFGAAALVRFAEVERTRWLVLAGVAAGLSCLVKIVGLYFVAGGLLALVYFERRPGTGSPARIYGIGLALALTAFVGAVWELVRRQTGVSGLVSFVVPPALVAAYLIFRELGPSADGFITRVRRLAALVGPFLAGVSLPIVAFLVPYALGGGLADLWRGVFVTPTRRLVYAATELPPFHTISAVLAPAAILGITPLLGSRARRWVSVPLALIAPYLMWQGHTARGYREVWYSMRWLIPVAAAAGVILLALRREGIPDTRRRQIFVLLAVAATCGLVQFPYSAPIYWLYAAPLAALAGAAVVSILPGTPGFPTVLILAFYLFFAVRWINPGFIYDMGLHYSRDTQTAVLAVDRGGLRVTPGDSAMYGRLVEAVRRQARGSWVYATPDCPEVSYLTGTRNPTRTLFDFFDDPNGRTQRILSALDQDAVHVVVINQKPAFSGPPPADLAAALEARFPNRITVGRFDVRWRE